MYCSKSPVRSAPGWRMIAEIKGQLALRPSSCCHLAVPRKTLLQCLLCGPGIVHLFAKKHRVPFQAFKKGQYGQDHAVAMTSQTTKMLYPEGLKECYSAQVWAWLLGFLIFIYILIYFHEKPSLFSYSVPRSAEDESVILYRKHGSA